MRVPVPFPVRSRDAAYGGASEDEIRAAVRSADRLDVPLELLRTVQHTVDVDRLSQYLANPDTDSDGGSPIVVERGGKFYIRNGNHRATAAMARGDRVLRGARVAHLGEPKSIRFHEGFAAEDLMMIDPRAMQATYRQRDVEYVAEVVDGIAIVCIDGPLEAKCGGWWAWFDDYESIFERYANAMHADDVSAVLFKIDSPGGAAAGLNECVDAMLRMRREVKKPVYVYADEGAYSAAYAIACVGDEVYLPRAGGLGSIGVISGLVDVTEMNRKDGIRYEVITSGARKADFNPNVPISKAAIARVQKRVDGLAKIYWQLVKETRGINAQKLEADTFYGRDAVRNGLADGVMSLDSLMSAIRTRLDKRGNSVSMSVGNGTPNAVTSRESTMSRILALTAKVTKAKMAYAEAKKADDAAAKFAAKEGVKSAEAALAKEVAKVTKNTKTVKTTDVHESESSSESSESSESSSMSESEEAESESASASYESEEKEILNAARSLTGKKTAREVIGALMALQDVAKDLPRTSARLAKLEQDRANAKIESLIERGKAEAKITPGNEKKAREIAAKYGAKALAAFLDAAVPAPAAKDHEPAEEIGDGLVITAEDRRVWTKMGIAEKDFPKYAKDLQKSRARLASKGN